MKQVKMPPVEHQDQKTTKQSMITNDFFLFFFVWVLSKTIEKGQLKQELPKLVLYSGW